jgi:hypothetical protein
VSPEAQRLITWARTEAAARIRKRGGKLTERAIQREGARLLRRKHG